MELDTFRFSNAIELLNDTAIQRRNFADATSPFTDKSEVFALKTLENIER